MQGCSTGAVSHTPTQSLELLTSLSLSLFLSDYTPPTNASNTYTLAHAYNLSITVTHTHTHTHTPFAYTDRRHASSIVEY